jgi:hypothetical protein
MVVVVEVKHQVLEVQVEAVVVVEDHQVVHMLEVLVTLQAHLLVKAIMVVLQNNIIILAEVVVLVQ